ncbi:MAG: hypothetical protein A3B38_01710 [Candidatus Levybacteria bacterium RIFCSPLOWO2_01_FULL_36_13]|nr:MAG: hypothetical protein A2684_02945 [Candidatus Levybacteria bacterium RIFCSPHIGHO2_01_FULL_36_15b]OGH35580.1 MAG: hypothetical protein A3B38_01710 [Candidatus Levybacteria bacterium RIFCSPLOWO2_01_FULL_36_13]
MYILKILLIIQILIFPIAELGKIQIGAISLSLNDIFMGFVFAIWIIKNKQNIKKQKPKLTRPIIFFIGVSVFSLIINLTWLSFSEFLISFLYLLRWVAYSSLYFIILSLDKEFLTRFKNILVIPITIFLFFGYVQFIFYQNLRNLYYLGWDEHLYRLFSTFFDPNFAGAFLVLTFIYLLYLSIQNIKKSKIFVPLTLIAALNLFAIYLTYSRSALIMLGTSLVVFLILLNKRKILFVTLIILLLLIFVAPKAFITEGTNILRIASIEARLDSAKVATDIFVKNPIIGIGFNSYRFAQHKYGYLKDEGWTTTHSGAGTDNSYLFILATTGIVGLITYIYLIYRILYISKTKNNLMSKVLIASVTGLLINSLFINSLFFVYIMEWIWIIVAFTENS